MRGRIRRACPGRVRVGGSNEFGRTWGPGCALVDLSPGWYGDPVCGGGCTVQAIDVAERVVLSQRMYPNLETGAIISAAHDATTDGLVVGYRNPGGDYYGDPYPGFGVVLLTLE